MNNFTKYILALIIIQLSVYHFIFSEEEFKREYDAIILDNAKFSWNIEKHGGIITSLCQDLDANLWVSTEDKGVWKLDLASQSIICMGQYAEGNENYGKEKGYFEQLMLEDGVIYALAVIRRGVYGLVIAIGEYQFIMARAGKTTIL